ncbi:HIT family protein [Candidatus Woesearchaeota archaeon]|nr:HIT family protein [Candidatus Woesearchaeota archaeon]
MSDCIFCKILAGELPSWKVYEDDYALAILDINPASKGHTLVISKRHYPHMNDFPEQEYLAFMASLRKVVKGMKKYTEALNILENDGKDAGQLVPHVHFHVIPRRPGDGLQIDLWRAQHDPDLDKVQKTIQSLLNE